MGFLDTVRADIDLVVHHTEKAVHNALVAAEAAFTEEKAALATEIRQAAGQVQATLKADAPEIEAALKKGAADLLTVVEAALKARGL